MLKVQRKKEKNLEEVLSFRYLTNKKSVGGIPSIIVHSVHKVVYISTTFSKSYVFDADGMWICVLSPNQPLIGLNPR